MEFFNKKEEVIDLQLTQYGKYLLSLESLSHFFMPSMMKISYMIHNMEAILRDKMSPREEFKTKPPTLRCFTIFTALKTILQEQLRLITAVIQI